MSEFTYTAFLIVASIVGVLMATLAAGILAVLSYDVREQAPDPRETTAERAELPYAA